MLKTCPSRRACLTRCRHCRIFFVCDPRNVGRRDLGCPFGCAQSHRKGRSTRRSVAYYQGEHGRLKKRIQNDKRRCQRPGISPPPSAAAGPPAGPRWPDAIVAYVRLVVGWIERRPVSGREIGELLARVVRQHRMARRRRIDQVVEWLNERPP